ncbi:MAG: VWA domain-containing protein [Thiomargarita sp.]|nr:VWA domain-containing protein [Thiomargarita sp.]
MKINLLPFIFIFGMQMSVATEPNNQIIQLDAALSTPIMLADKKQTVYLRIGLTGLQTKQSEIVPINVSLVIDKSGSMQGVKIRRAKDAAIMVVEQLRQEDIISIVTYNHSAEIMLPATKILKKESIKQIINQITASGQTALFDGVEKGSQEVRKFFDRKRVNRIILVSDGLANVGPQTPAELGQFGASLGEEGIVVTTIGLGLGYNEDLMTQLAKKSDGNHAFAENASDLARFFNYEFNDIFSVVSQEVNVTVICLEGVRPIRALGREVEINNERALAKLNQLYTGQEKYLLLELEVPATKSGVEQMLAGVAVVYRDMKTDKMKRISQVITANFTDSSKIVEENINATVMTAAIEQLAVENNKQAVKLRDEGKVKAAKKLLIDNAAYLEEESAKYDSKELEKLRDLNIDDAENIEDEEDWKKQRKSMRREQYKSDQQQTY